jgi:sulfate adenylyltransferase subunit 1 (EFTu-like GTPase family)
VESPDGCSRGEIICKNAAFEVTRKILARIFCVRELPVGRRVVFKYLTQRSPAHVARIKRIINSSTGERQKVKDAVEEMDIAEVAVAVDNCVAIARDSRKDAAGRFVLEDDAGVCAAGMIIPQQI